MKTRSILTVAVGLAVCLASAALVPAPTAAFKVSGDGFTGLTYYVNTGTDASPNSAGGDGTTTNTSGGTRAFATLREAVDSLPGTITTATRIYTMGSKADLLRVVQTNLDFVTSPTAYVAIIQAATDRHLGVWRTDAYRREVTNENNFYNNIPGHLRVDGLQFRVYTDGSSGASYNAVKGSTANVGSGLTNCDIRLSNLLIQSVTATGATDAITGVNMAVWAGGPNAGQGRVWNCLVYGGRNGFVTDGVATNTVYMNCTSISNWYGFNDAQNLTNCLASYQSELGFVGTPDVTMRGDYNASKDGTANFGSHSRNNQTFTFVNSGASDFHLHASDSGARGFGMTDPGAGLFNDDVDGVARSVPWSIGYDQ